MPSGKRENSEMEQVVRPVQAEARVQLRYTGERLCACKSRLHPFSGRSQKHIACFKDGDVVRRSEKRQCASVYACMQ